MTAQENTKKTLRFDPAAATLWASAFVIAALLIIQIGKLPGNPAYAEMSSSRSNFTILTADSGRGDNADPDEVLWVADSRGAWLLVYEIEQRSLQLRASQSIVGLFRAASGR